jgi:hypothetical protein
MATDQYAFDFFVVEDDAVQVLVTDDGTETSLLILDEDQYSFTLNPRLDTTFNIDRV